MKNNYSFQNINFYIITLKTIFEKLQTDLITRDYKLLNKNSQHYNLYIYNRITLNEIAIT